MEAGFLCCFTAIHNSVPAISAPRYQEVCLWHQLKMDVVVWFPDQPHPAQTYVYIGPKTPPLARWQGTPSQKQKYPGLPDVSACTQHFFGWTVSTVRAEHTPAQSTHPEASSAKAWGEAPSHSQPYGLLQWGWHFSTLRDHKIHQVVLVVFIEEKREDSRQGTIGFPLLRFSVCGAQGTLPEDSKDHPHSLCKTCDEVVAQVRYSRNPGETCHNSESFLGNSVVFAFIWKKLLLSTLTCLYKRIE